MKYTTIGLFIFASLFINGCVDTNHIQGTYGYDYGKIIFTQLPNRFEYFGGFSENGGMHYSKGHWMLADKNLLLSGFNDSTIKLLEVSSSISNDEGGIGGRITIGCQVKNRFARVDIVVNDNLVINLRGDTSFTFDTSFRRIQLRSYLYHPGLLLSAPPTIDTLYSKKIDIEGARFNHPIVKIEFTIDNFDFNREKLADTLRVRNKRTLQWKKATLKKR